MNNFKAFYEHNFNFRKDKNGLITPVKRRHDGLMATLPDKHAGDAVPEVHRTKHKAIQTEFSVLSKLAAQKIANDFNCKLPINKEVKRLKNTGYALIAHPTRPGYYKKIKL